MKYREAVDLLRNTNDVKSIQYILDELIREKISYYKLKLNKTQSVIYWMPIETSVKPKYGKEYFVKCKNGNIKISVLKESDNRFYEVKSGIDITDSVVYYGKLKNMK